VYYESYFVRFLHRKSSYYGTKGDFNAQLGNYHTLKAGFDAQRHTLRRYENLNATQVLSDVRVNTYGFTQDAKESDSKEYINALKHPINLGLFLQDRFEWRGLVINAGIRFDYFDYQALKIKDLANPLDPDNATGLDTLDVDDLEDSEVFTRFSPRLGIGFPISDKTQFHINYGKMYQRPNLEDLYVGYDFFAARVKDGGYYFPFPSPNLEPEQTTQYEVGITHQLGMNTAFGITAYYKDVQGLTQIFHQTADPNQYDFYANTDFGTIKGVDFNLTMRRTRNMRINLNYTISWATGTGSYSQSTYNVAWKNPKFPPKATNPLDYDQRHNITGVLDIRTEKGDGPKIGEIFPLENFSFNALIQLASGTPYSPTLPYDAAREGISVSQQPTGAVNSATMPWNMNVDLKIERTFKINDNYTIVPYLWIQNVFGTENVYGVYEGTGEANVTGYLESVEGLGWVNSHTDDEIAQYRLKENNPKNYGKPRIIMLGVKMSF
ncbi:MAG: TonB-dependent receptor, partial [Candidatus Zixiibacteriota bacterium]